jgi:hypothetical protein
MSLRLDQLSEPLQAIIRAQAQQGQHLLISTVDAQGRLIATPDSERILQPVLDELPGAAAALAGHTETRTGTDPQGQQWLYSVVPVSSVGWAVVVQRPTAEVLAAVTNFRTWIPGGAARAGPSGPVGGRWRWRGRSALCAHVATISRPNSSTIATSSE